MPNTADPRYHLPPTGQTTAYTAANDRDDGEVQAGKILNNRFVTSDQNTVYDKHTGLEWIDRPGLIIPGGTGPLLVARGDWTDSTLYTAGDLVRDVVDGNTFWACLITHTGDGGGTNRPAADVAGNWSETVWVDTAASLVTEGAVETWLAANANSAALTPNGKSDWRLPNIVELFSIRDAENSALYSAFTSSDATKDKWSSTTRKIVTSDAYNLQVDNGQIVILAKGAVRSVQPVRGGFHIPYG